MNRVEDGFQPKPMFHGKSELGEHLARSGADDGDAEDAVFPRYGQNLDEAFSGLVGYGAVKPRQLIEGGLVSNPLLLCFCLAEPNSRDLGVGEVTAGKAVISTLNGFTPPNRAFRAAKYPYCPAAWVNCSWPTTSPAP